MCFFRKFDNSAMNMKSKIYVGILIGLMISFSSCDYIDPPYSHDAPKTCDTVVVTFTPRLPGEKMKKVLVEDMTGHRCGNCPRAAETIVTLKTTYGEQVIAIGLHSSIPESFTGLYPTDTVINPEQKYVYDFRTTVATAIDAYFGVSAVALPNGMVNRKSFSGSTVLDHNTWSSHVATELSTPQQLDIQLKNFWDPTSNAICSFYYVEAMQNLSSSYNICLYLLEDSLVHWQKDYLAAPSDIELYTHRHVLRGAINGDWQGTQVNGGAPLTDGGEYILSYTIDIDPSKWDVDHLYVVGFVYDAVTYEVLQAEEVKLIP
jgi:hypothetical protein